jgi:hypothetical protein
MEALRKSVADAQGRRGPGTDSRKTKAAPKSGSRGRQKAPARKSA